MKKTILLQEDILLKEQSPITETTYNLTGQN